MKTRERKGREYHSIFSCKGKNGKEESLMVLPLSTCLSTRDGLVSLIDAHSCFRSDKYNLNNQVCQVNRQTTAPGSTPGVE